MTERILVTVVILGAVVLVGVLVLRLWLADSSDEGWADSLLDFSVPESRELVIPDNCEGRFLGDEKEKIVFPVEEFEKRITKKPFGLYVSPGNSLVEGEVFKGYHTGVDVEYEDVASEVPVRSAADGKVLVARSVSGYGGAAAISRVVDGQAVIGIYGYLDPSSLPAVGDLVTSGQEIGVLGEGYSKETDGERKHLHFGLVKGEEIDLRGYVDDEDSLGGWIDLGRWWYLEAGCTSSETYETALTSSFNAIIQ